MGCKSLGILCGTKQAGSKARLLVTDTVLTLWSLHAYYTGVGTCHFCVAVTKSLTSSLREEELVPAQGIRGHSTHHGGEEVAELMAAKTDHEVKIRKQDGNQE